MRVLVAGASGAIGRPLMRALAAAGHERIAIARDDERARALEAEGIEAHVADVFDRAAVVAACRAARPDVVSHQLTALPPAMDMRRYGTQLEPTNRLRAETIPHFVAGAREAGARRIVVQSIAFLTAPEGPEVVDESARPFLDAPGGFDAAVRANLAGERATVDAEGIEGVVLRYGYFYGPGTYYAPGGPGAEDVRRRRFPIVGDGGGRWSFVHVEDAAEATVAALERGAGVINVCDDEPARVADWVPVMAELQGGRPPRHVPPWLARAAVGGHAVHFSTALRGASNARARRELGWEPRRATWREGFAEVFG